MNTVVRVLVNSIEESEQFKRTHAAQIADIEKYLSTIPNVHYSDIWMNGNSPSYIAGLDKEDSVIVSVPLSYTEEDVRS